MIIYFIATAVLLFGWLCAAGATRNNGARMVVHFVGIVLTAWLGAIIYTDDQVQQRLRAAAGVYFTTVAEKM